MHLGTKSLVSCYNLWVTCNGNHIALPYDYMRNACVSLVQELQSCIREVFLCRRSTHGGSGKKHCSMSLKKLKHSRFWHAMFVNKIKIWLKKMFLWTEYCSIACSLVRGVFVLDFTVCFECLAVSLKPLGRGKHKTNRIISSVRFIYPVGLCNIEILCWML